MTISNDSRARIKKAFEPIALGLGRLGLSPDALTLIGFAITVVGAILVAGQLWLAGGIVIFIGGVFDLFDGTLARATGRVSNLGAFMDSVFDRAGEGVVYVGVAVGCVAAGYEGLGGFGVGAVLAASALASSALVSYTRAKSEGLGFTSGIGMAAVGIMPREVRLVILSLGLIATGLMGGVIFDYDSQLMPVYGDLDQGRGALFLALGIITVGSTLTVIQRILHVRNQAKTPVNPDPPLGAGEQP